MLVESEAGSAPRESLAIVREAASSICSDDPALGEWFETYARHHVRRIAFDLDMLRRHGSSANAILEYGAVPLLLTRAAHLAGLPVVGLDIHPERFASAIRSLGLDVRKCDVEREAVPFPDSSFDLVVFNEIFEHLRIDPIFTLREAHRVLTPGGTLLLSTPNLKSLRGIVNFLWRNECHSCTGGVYDQFEKLATLGHAGHVREYTTREVREFLERIGFRVERMIFRGGYRGLAARVITHLSPGLRPYVTYVARKAAARRPE